jgi:hypothetical protein
MTMTKLARCAPAFRHLGFPEGLTLARAYDLAATTDGGGYASLLGTHIYKAELGVARGALNAIQYCAPERESGIVGFTSCAFASEGCAATCIKTTGHSVTDMAQRARIKRTLRWFLDPVQANRDLGRELTALERRAERKDLVPTARLDGTSDLRFWAQVEGWEDRPTRFYDYTKRPPTTLHLDAYRRGWGVTYSLSEDPSSMAFSRRWAAAGVNTAIVVGGPVGSTRPVAEAIAAELVRRGEFVGRPTIDGDQDDLRWLDPQVGGWVILSAKGSKVKHDKTGFVVRFDPAVLLGTDWSPETALLSEFDRQRFINNDNAAAAAK